MTGTNDYQMRLFTLDWRAEDVKELQIIGKQNFQQSLEKEAGTLFMAMGSEPDQPERTYVIEIYADEVAYQAHTQSEHFRAFAAFASDHLQGRQVETLTPQLLVEKTGPLSLLSENEYSLRLAWVTVKPDEVVAFKRIVEAEMIAAIQKEPGLRSLFATQVTGQENQWLFVELYQDEAAYQAHRRTPHFEDYIEATKDMILDKTLTSLNHNLVVSKGNLSYSTGALNLYDNTNRNHQK